MNITAEAIKASVASYWRYTRQCPLVALEASCRLEGFNDGGQADILVVTKARFLIEIEVKLSLSDFRRDKGKLKHQAFRGGRVEYPSLYRRHYLEYPTHSFYFAVPKELCNKVSVLCDKLYPYAGVIGSNGIGAYDVEIYREPKTLWGTKLDFKQLLRMTREQSATICRLSKKLAGVDD